MTDSTINSLALTYGTPLYLFDFDSLQDRVSALERLTPANTTICYAIKANPFLAKPLAGREILFEACSPGELHICLQNGIAPQKIVFSGVCKSLEDIRSAYRAGVHTITLESLNHCKYLVEVMGSAEEFHLQQVILRLTSGNQFGMSSKDIHEAVVMLKDKPYIKVRGIHYFSGTQKKWAKIETEIQEITNFCDKLNTDTGIAITEIEYGPGLSVDYFSHGCNNSVEEYKKLCTLIADSRYHFTIEAGRYISASCGSYASRIVDLKTDADTRYCLIDGGIHHINYYGQIMGMKLPEIVHMSSTDKTQGSISEEYCVCGSLCTTADVVVKALPLCMPQLHDLLIFKNIGAYSVTESPYLFLSHALPRIIAIQDNRPVPLRDFFETYPLNCAQQG